MRSKRFDWWNDEHPEKEAAFQALLGLAKELKRQPTLVDVEANEQTRRHRAVFVGCWGSVREACLAVGMYLRSHPQEAVGMDESLWRDGEYTVRYIPVTERVPIKKDKNGAVVSSWRGYGQKKPPRQAKTKPIAEMNRGTDEHKDEVQKQVAEQVLQAAMKVAVTQEVKEQGGSSMATARKYSDYVILTKLRKFYLENGCFPTQTGMNRSPDMPSYMVVRKRIGNMSEWPAALEREFGSDWMKPPEEGERPETESTASAVETSPAEEPEATGAVETADTGTAEKVEPVEEVGTTENVLDVRLVGTYEVTAIVNGERRQLKLSFGEQ